MIAIIDEKRREVAELCRRFRVRRLELFGSAAGDEFDAGRSDLDFLVVFEPCTPAEYSRRYFGLLASLEDLFALKVDVVDLEAVWNPYFRQGIERSRRLLYAA